MKILITGNMGYVGPVVVRHLRTVFPSARLEGLDLGYFAHCLTNAEVAPESRLNVQHFGDVRSVSPDILQGVDGVVHLAAISNDPMGNAFAGVTEEINHRATLRLAEQARGAGARVFVFASSCSVYGFAEEGARTEASPVNPLTAYARSKVQSEQGLEKLANDAFRVVCLRFPTACGMSERLRLDLVLNDFAAGAVSSRLITVLSDGTPWRPLIDVRDMARAVEWALWHSHAAGTPFVVVNAGSDSCNYQVRELAEAVAAVVPGTAVSINKDAQPDRRSYRVDFSAYRKLAPDHQPRVDLTASIQGLYQGLAAMRFADADFRNSRYMRLNVLRDLREKGLLNEDLEWSSSASDFCLA
jgi:nucleoside-diphosphate-sugar epimerase